MQRHTVSILTPNYNYGRFIGDALASTTQFDSELTQILVQDALSTDDSKDVTLQHMRSSPNIAWASTSDKGQSDALNLALDRAGGEWVGWLNSDEFYLPGALDGLGEIFDDPKVAVVYGDCYFVDGGGKVIRLLPSHKFDRAILRRYGCFISSCATFSRRSVLESLRWNDNLKRAMDWDLWLRASGAGRMVYVPKPIAAFRLHPGQVTHAPEDSAREEFAMIARAHGLTEPGRTAHTVHRRIGKTGHSLRKIREGSYLRELRAKQSLTKKDIRWWLGPSQNSNANLAASI